VSAGFRAAVIAAGRSIKADALIDAQRGDELSHWRPIEDDPSVGKPGG
jgi:hypothetical protein